MPRIFFILFLLLLTVKPVFADVAEDIKEYNKKTLPPVGSALDVSGVNITVPPNPTSGASSNLSGEESKIYNSALSELIKDDPLNQQTFFEKILAFFQDLFGQGAKEVGNESAQNFLNARLPQGVGEQMIARINNTTELAQNNNTNVLGTVSNEAMDLAFPAIRCANLPFGSCDYLKATASPVPELSPTIDPLLYPTTYPIPNGQGYYRDTAKCRPFDYIKSPVTLPAICYEQPGNFIKDATISNGKCDIPDKGFCSPDCLKPFFANDEKMARKAAMICYKESGGKTYYVNKGCRNGISNEYSVGLFQINLKNEDSNNPWTKMPRSYQCRNTVEPVGQISCTDGAEINSCTEKFSKPEINIPEAWNLWYDRYLYYTDLCTVYGGGLPWIWKGWTAAYPEHCDIRY